MRGHGEGWRRYRGVLRRNVSGLCEGARESSGEETGLEAERMAWSWCQDERSWLGNSKGEVVWDRGGQGASKGRFRKKAGEGGSGGRGRPGRGAQRMPGGQRLAGRDGPPVP